MVTRGDGLGFLDKISHWSNRYSIDAKDTHNGKAQIGNLGEKKSWSANDFLRSNTSQCSQYIALTLCLLPQSK